MPDNVPKSASGPQPAAPGSQPDAPDSKPRAITPDYMAKQTQILAASVAAAQNILANVVRLAECGGLLSQSGGNFVDEVFTPPNNQFVYIDPDSADTLLQKAAPELDAFLDTNVSGDVALPTYRQLFQQCAKGPT